MHRGLETLGAVMVLAVGWMSISRLQAGSTTATAMVSIRIPEQQDSAVEPDAGLEPLAALPPTPAQDIAHTTTTTVRHGGRNTVLHTQIPEI